MPVEQDNKLVKLITGRQSKLESEKTNFTDRLQDVADLVAPHREDVRGTYLKNEQKGKKIYDGTALGAAVLATDGIHGYHVSPAFPWFKYAMNRKYVNKIAEVREWLQEIEFNMYQALSRSNFYSEMWMYIYDGLTAGTATIFGEEDLIEDRISFETVHPGEIYIQENRYGEVDLLHRKYKRTTRKLVQMFGLDNLTPQCKQVYESSPFTEYEIIHAVFPREEYDNRMMDAKNKKYASIWLLLAGNHICRISGFDNFPFAVWRYMRSGKGPYGISPAMLAIADIKGLNIIDKCDLGARQMALDPPLNVPSYMEGKVEWKPRGINYYKEGSQGKDIIYPANIGANFPSTDTIVERKQRALKERFHVDTFLMLSSLEGRGDRTAYEVSEMMAEKAAVLGAELGPLNTELDDLNEIVYDIESAAGRMPDPPDILFQLAANDPSLRFDPVYMGPLAQAQREKFSKTGIRKFFTEIAPIVNVKPEALDKINADAAVDILGEINNVPQEILYSDDEVAKTRKGRLIAQQQQTALENMQGMAEGVKTASEADQNMNGKLSGLMGA